ncbi:MAG TPA: PilT/PilU family type 4a pilus ATPase [Lachnospiraceae bacterium]|nr:PilT/PilU family type 4a pilus ATPase [Lachnospiraceae bacterium]
MEIRETLAQITNAGASDIFIVAGLPLTFKLHGKMHTYDAQKLTPQMTSEFITNIYLLAEGRDMDHFYQSGDDDFSFAIPGVARYRANTFKQRGSLSAVIRVITFTVPNPIDIGIPNNIIELVNRQKGLVLITGPAGSGKSTTLACMIDAINSSREAHIITLEDPLEYLHMHKMSIVSQREVNTDTDSYLTALRASLRQSPDVILLGEMRDYETMNVAMTAAETGHLILSTLHTIGAANTIDRIIDAFPPNQQHQISIQLSMVLQAVVSQQLVPTEDGRMVPAFEIMTITPAIRNMIRESKIHQIDGMIYSSSADSNMLAMDTSLLKLYQDGTITEKTALTYATNADLLQKKLRG